MGFEEAKLVAHVDGSASTVCSIKPVRLASFNHSSRETLCDLI